MKAIYCFVFFLFSLSITYSQDITATLSGNTSSQGFSIINAQGDTLLRALGDGSVGIGTNNPLGILDIESTSTSDGRPIYIYGENTSSGGGKGGDVEIRGGSNVYSQKGGQIILAGESMGGGAYVNINAGDGGTGGGNINLTSGSGSSFGGSINLTTPFSYEGANDINLNAGGGVNGGGSITISTGSASGSGFNNVGPLNLSTGDGQINGNINIHTGNITDGGNINLTPSISGGLVIVNGSGTYSGTWTQASDERFKKNIKPLRNVLQKIEQLEGVSYKYRKHKFPDKNFADGKQIGLIAQNVEKVFPELVKTDKDGYKSVAYQNMVAVLIEAVKEQQSSIQELKKEIETLKSSLKDKDVKVTSVAK